MRDARPLRGPGGAAECERWRRSRAPIASSPRSCIPTPTRHDPKAAARFAELNAAYEILGDEDKRKAFDRGEIDAEGKPRFQGFEGFGAGSRGGRLRSGRPGAHFETFTLGPEGFQPLGRRRRRRFGGGIRRHSARHVRRRGARCAAGVRHAVRGRGFRAAPGARQDLQPRSPSRSTEAAKGRRPARPACRPARKSTSRFRPASPTASRSG